MMIGVRKMKVESATRIQYLKNCRKAISRDKHASDDRLHAIIGEQLGAIVEVGVRKEAERRFQDIVSSRNSLSHTQTRFRREVCDAFDELISFLEQYAR